MDRRLIEDIKHIADHFTALPELDDRHPDEILGYDQRGLPWADGEPLHGESVGLLKSTG